MKDLNIIQIYLFISIESYLPTIPDLISLRDMMVDDSKRSTTKVSFIVYLIFCLHSILNPI